MSLGVPENTLDVVDFFVAKKNRLPSRIYDCRRVPLDGRLLDWSAWRSELQDAKFLGWDSGRWQEKPSWEI